MNRWIVLFCIFYFVCFESITASFSSRENQTAVNSEIKELTDDSSISKKLRVNVYYETLCVASRSYLTTEVKYVIDKLWPYVDVHMIPYGHAQTIRLRRSYKFNCQHGPKECYGNKVQACAIDNIRNNTLATLFNICFIKNFAHRNYNNNTPLLRCAHKHHVSAHGIKTCADTRKGATLLKKYGDETHKLRPPFVPYVTFDNSTESVEGNLFVEICQILKPTPPNCLSTTINNNYNRRNYCSKKLYDRFSPTKLSRFHARQKTT